MKKNILITGASSGVGKTISEHLSQNGYHVIAAARRIEKMSKIYKKNVSIEYLDLNNIESIEYFIKNIVNKYGNINYVINNAGININKYIDRVQIEDLNISIRVNALSPFMIIKNLLGNMLENNFGRIINITSGAPLNCFEGFASYSASKSVLNTLTITTAKEYKSKNVKINLMSPGPVKTEMAPDAKMDPSVCLPTLEYLLNLDESGPTGKFFWLGYEIPLFPDLKNIDWLKGKGGKSLKKVL